MANENEKQVIDLPGARVDTLWTTVESGTSEDGTEYEKRQQTAPKTFERCVTDDDGKNLSEKLSEMQEQINGATSDVTGTVNAVIDERLEINLASKEELESVAEKQSSKIGQLINPNILINPDFKINQRAGTNYAAKAGTPQIYTFDRWKTFQGAENVINVRRIVDETSGAHIESTGEGWAVGQYIENFEDYAGKTVTISAKIQDMAGGWRIFVSETDTLYHLLDFDNIINGIVKATFTLSASVTRLLTCFHFTDSLNDGGGWIDLEWIKLEVGDMATSYMPPDPATELARCQRYFFRTYSANSNIIEIWDNYTASKRIYFPTTMRILPTITLMGEGTAILAEDNLPYYSQDGIECNGKGLTDGNSWLIDEVRADAEIY